MNVSAATPSSTGRFLKALSWFVKKVLRPSGELPTASQLHFRMDLDTMEAFPHRLLNLSEKVAVEQLMSSEEPLVVLFPDDSQAIVEDQLSLDGALLQQLLAKLQAVIQDLKAIPSFQDNLDHFHALLDFCYYPSGARGSPPNGLGSLRGRPGNLSAEAKGSGAQEKFHSLLLLKALQAVRARWRETRKASPRAHRSPRHQDDYCQLRELKVHFFSMGNIIIPESHNIKNCAGPCRIPISTRVADYYHHTVFLLRMQEQGQLLRRAPCCVPVRYSKLFMATYTADQTVVIKAYPSMVAEACGCR